MVEKVIYSNHVGTGIICNTEKEVEQIIEKVNITINNVDIEHGTLTDLSGFFLEKIKYLGLLKNENHKVMVFLLGYENDFFEKKIYLKTYFKISNNRIADKYSYSGCRDFNYVENKWK